MKTYSKRKVKEVIQKIVTWYIDAMSNYLFPDQHKSKNVEEEKKVPKIKNDRDRIFFK